MKNSKIELFSQVFSSLIFIFASISQKWFKKWLKNFFLRFSWKFPYNLILIWRIQRSNLFSHNFSFASSFLPRLVKNVLKMGQVFFLRFSWKLPYNLILIWRIQKSNSFFQIFSSSSSFLALTFPHPYQANSQCYLCLNLLFLGKVSAEWENWNVAKLIKSE